MFERELQLKNLRSLSYPALACADIVHVALVRMLIDTHRFSTAVKVLQRIISVTKKKKKIEI